MPGYFILFKWWSSTCNQGEGGQNVELFFFRWSNSVPLCLKEKWRKGEKLDLKWLKNFLSSLLNRKQWDPHAQIIARYIWAPDNRQVERNLYFALGSLFEPKIISFCDFTQEKIGEAALSTDLLGITELLKGQAPSTR